MWNESLFELLQDTGHELHGYHVAQYGYAAVIWLANWKAVYSFIRMAADRPAAANSWWAQVQNSYLWPDKNNDRRRLNNWFEDQLLELL